MPLVMASQSKRPAPVPDGLVAQARADALRYLGPRARTQWEVEQRLAQRQYPPPVIAEVIAYLRERRYVDDAEFARLYIEQQLAGRRPPGRRRLEASLRRRGVPADIVAEALAAGLVDTDPVATAVELVRQRLERNRFPDPVTAYRRLAGFLVRQGYDHETVAQALASVRSTIAEQRHPS